MPNLLCGGGSPTEVLELLHERHAPASASHSHNRTCTGRALELSVPHIKVTQDLRVTQEATASADHSRQSPRQLMVD